MYYTLVNLLVFEIINLYFDIVSYNFEVFVELNKSLIHNYL